MRSGVLGSIGLIFLLYTVISMVQKVEESFNFVWRVEQPRSIGRRFSEYLSVMVVGPAVIVAALGLIATLSNTRAMRYIAQYEPFGTILVMLGHLTPYLLVIGVFTFLYAFIPNTSVRLRAALDRRRLRRRRVGGQRHDVRVVRGGHGPHDGDLCRLCDRRSSR